jgi:predicted  nucleic acid-binding Zn-ribbon protein
MGLLDKAYEQSKLNTLDSSEVKDVGEACNELDDVRQAITNKEAEIKQLKDREYQLENEVIPSFFETAGVSSRS